MKIEVMKMTKILKFKLSMHQVQVILLVVRVNGNASLQIYVLSKVIFVMVQIITRMVIGQKIVLMELMN